MVVWTCSIESNHCAVSHSSRNEPLNNSAAALSGRLKRDVEIGDLALERSQTREAPVLICSQMLSFRNAGDL